MKLTTKYLQWISVLGLLALANCAIGQAPKSSIGTVASDILTKNVYWEQKLNSQIAMEAPFKDESGKDVKIADYFKTKPVVLLMPFYKCPGTCLLEMEGAIRACNSINYEIGKDFDVLVVGIDSRETAELAAAKKKDYVSAYSIKGAEKGIHCLTGTKESIDKLADSVGFHYMLDPKSGSPIHSAGLMILTPHGKMSRYLLGVDYGPRNLNMALVEASENKIGTLTEKITLLCSMYDEHNGKYSIAIIRILQVAGCGTALLLGAFILTMLKLEHKRKVNGIDQIKTETT